MAYWGIAYAYGPHVNKPMSEEDSVQAWAAVRQALALKSRANAKEQAFIEAMADRYQEPFAEDRSALDKAYAEAMRKVVQAVSGRSRCADVVRRSADGHDAVGLLGVGPFAQAEKRRRPWRRCAG